MTTRGSFFRRRKPIDPGQLDLLSNKLGISFYESSLDSSSSVGSRLRAKIPTHASRVVGADVFTMLYDWRPNMKTDPPNEELAKMLGDLMNTLGFADLRKQTMGRRAMSTAAAARVMDLLAEQKPSQTNKAKKGAGKGGEQGEGQGEGESEDSGQGEPSGQSMGQVAEKKLKEMAEQAGAANSLDAVDRDSQAGFGGGWGHEDSVNTSGINAFLDDSAFANQAKFLAAMMKVAGRMEAMVESITATGLQQSVTPIDITVGDDLGAMLPSELTLLAHPDTRKMFLVKWAERGLTIYDKRELLGEGRGPMVFCIDMSGSMFGGGNYEAPDRESAIVYATSFFYVMARQAIKEGRKALLIPFANEAYHTIPIATGKDLAEAVAIQQRYGGGTDFASPLHRAMEAIRKESDFEKADIIFVTDGQADIDTGMVKTINEFKEGTHAKILGVNIDGRWRIDMKSILDASVEIKGGEMGSLEWFGEMAKKGVI